MTNKSLEILIVEDDHILGVSIKKFLESRIGIPVKLFFESFDCLEYLSDQNPHYRFCLVTDISLKNGSDGLLLIDILKERKYNFISIAMTGFASVQTAIAATKKGVYQYLTKPFDLNHLTTIVLEALENKFCYKQEDSFSYKKNTVSKSSYQLENPTEADCFMGIIGRSSAMQEIFEKIKKVANCPSTVLITGPSGAGKELVAQAIHKLSERSKNEIVSVNCGAIPGELLESELFGHVKGAFTGALSDRKGRFEIAQEGTIFLDEIGDMPPLLQVKILRVLQEKQIEMVGSSKKMPIDVRIIAATHRNLEEQIKQNKFREDLYYRLNVIPIKIPSLHERKEDIPLLISYFLGKFVSANGSNKVNFTSDALAKLCTYNWPGNVRELENVIERLVILRGGSEITAEDLPSKIYNHFPENNKTETSHFNLPENGIDLKQYLHNIEGSLIKQALERTLGNKNQASKLLGMNRTTLIEKIKKFHFEVKEEDEGYLELSH